MSINFSPLFIVGCARSGTTLLETMLNKHPEICINHESHFIIDLMRRYIFGRKYRGKNSLSDFVNDLLSHKRYSLWQDKQKINRNEFSYYRGKSVPEIYEAVFSRYAHGENKSMWGDKTPKYVNFIVFLSEIFPESRFIHIIRDGRDVALSAIERKWGPGNLWQSAHYWKIQTTLGIVAGRWLKFTGQQNRYLEIKYEDLLNNTEAILRNICTFLNVNYHDSMLTYYESSAKHIPEAYSYVHRKVKEKPDTSRIGKWKNEMSRNELIKFEKIAGSLLTALNYETITQHDPAQYSEKYLSMLFQRARPYKNAAYKASTNRMKIKWSWIEKSIDYCLGNYESWILHDLHYQSMISYYTRNLVLF